MIGNLNVSSMSGKSDQLNSIIEKILMLDSYGNNNRRKFS